MKLFGSFAISLSKTWAIPGWTTIDPSETVSPK
jgi:hypothetical protein